MKIIAPSLRFFLCTFVVSSLSLTQPISVHAQQSSCVTCHGGLGDERLTPPVTDWRQSVHSSVGVDCHSCHGGDPSIPDEGAMATKDFIGVPAVKNIPELCASCHSDPDKMRPYNLRVDEYDLFKRSAHGRDLYERGDTKVATCVSCHGSHKILSKEDVNSPVHYTNVPRMCGRCHSDPEYMKGYGIPTDQLAKYNKSYHAQILYGEIPGKNPALAPTCASCHTHSPLLPAATEVPEICGRCHSVTARYYKDGPHYVSLNEVGAPKCIDCHGNHEILYPSAEMFSGTKEGHCGSCHDPSSSEYATGQQIRSLLDSATEEVKLMTRNLDEIKDSGRNLSDLQTLAEESRTSLTEVLPITHTMSVDRIKEKAAVITTDAGKLLQKVTGFKAELKTRKRDLAIVLSVILVNIALLYWKRRSLER